MAMPDRGLSDIGIHFFIVGLIQCRTRGLYSDKFLCDMGLGRIGVGYRTSATKIPPPPPMVITLPYAENKVEHKMNLVRIGHKEKNIYFSAKR
jgi:hypothetical protein